MSGGGANEERVMRLLSLAAPVLLGVLGLGAAGGCSYHDHDNQGRGRHSDCSDEGSRHDRPRYHSHAYRPHYDRHDRGRHYGYGRYGGRRCD